MITVHGKYITVPAVDRTCRCGLAILAKQFKQNAGSKTRTAVCECGGKFIDYAQVPEWVAGVPGVVGATSEGLE